MDSEPHHGIFLENLNFHCIIFWAELLKVKKMSAILEISPEKSPEISGFYFRAIFALKSEQLFLYFPQFISIYPQLSHSSNVPAEQDYFPSIYCQIPS